MPLSPETAVVDINLFAHDAAATVAAAIDSVVAQDWPDWRLTLIDDGSCDTTGGIMVAYAASDRRIRLKRNRANTGAVGAFQRAFWFGDADFVMPKSADDLIAPDFVSRIMAILRDHPQCVMAHAAGLSFAAGGTLQFLYPPEHNLHAVGEDAVGRACHVMRHYTSSPAFWGIYRRGAVDRLAPIAHRAGWDHVLLAELALYGEIRHVAEALLWRRGAGRPILHLARAATAEHARGLTLDDPIADPLWRMPCITTAYAHMENFSLCRLPAGQRGDLMQKTAAIFRRRWGSLMHHESEALRAHVADAASDIRRLDPIEREIALLHLQRMLAAAATLLPDADLADERRMLDMLVQQEATCPI